MKKGLSAKETLRRSLVWMAIAVLVVATIGTVVGYLGKGTPGLAAGLTAGALGLVMLGITAFTHPRCLANADLAMAWMGLDFFGKFLVIGGALLVIKKFSNFDPLTLALTLIAIFLVLLAVQMAAVSASHTALLDTPPASESE